MSTKRSVQEGHQKDHITAFQALADFEKANFPGVVAATMAYEEKDPCQTHTFMAFANMAAFEAWWEEAGKEGTPFREKLDAMVAHYDLEKPYSGECWSSDGNKLDPLAAAMKGSYVHYDYPVIG